jgi:hypothetical protein
MKLEKAEKRKEKLLDKANKEAEIENRPKVLAWIREVRKK